MAAATSLAHDEEAPPLLYNSDSETVICKRGSILEDEEEEFSLLGSKKKSLTTILLGLSACVLLVLAVVGGYQIYLEQYRQKEHDKHPITEEDYPPWARQTNVATSEDQREMRPRALNTGVYGYVPLASSDKSTQTKDSDDNIDEGVKSVAVAPTKMKKPMLNTGVYGYSPFAAQGKLGMNEKQVESQLEKLIPEAATGEDVQGLLTATAADNLSLVAPQEDFKNAPIYAIEVPWESLLEFWQAGSHNLGEGIRDSIDKMKVGYAKATAYNIKDVVLPNAPEVNMRAFKEAARNAMIERPQITQTYNAALTRMWGAIEASADYMKPTKMWFTDGDMENLTAPLRSLGGEGRSVVQRGLRSGDSLVKQMMRAAPMPELQITVPMRKKSLMELIDEKLNPSEFLKKLNEIGLPKLFVNVPMMPDVGGSSRFLGKMLQRSSVLMDQPAPPIVEVETYELPQSPKQMMMRNSPPALLPWYGVSYEADDATESTPGASSSSSPWTPTSDLGSPASSTASTNASPVNNTPSSPSSTKKSKATMKSKAITKHSKRKESSKKKFAKNEGMDFMNVLRDLTEGFDAMAQAVVAPVVEFLDSLDGSSTSKKPTKKSNRTKKRVQKVMTEAKDTVGAVVDDATASNFLGGKPVSSVLDSARDLAKDTINSIVMRVVKEQKEDSHEEFLKRMKALNQNSGPPMTLPGQDWSVHDYLPKQDDDEDDMFLEEWEVVDGTGEWSDGDEDKAMKDKVAAEESSNLWQQILDGLYDPRTPPTRPFLDIEGNDEDIVHEVQDGENTYVTEQLGPNSWRSYAKVSSPKLTSMPPPPINMNPVSSSSVAPPAAPVLRPSKPPGLELPSFEPLPASVLSEDDEEEDLIAPTGENKNKKSRTLSEQLLEWAKISKAAKILSERNALVDSAAVNRLPESQVVLLDTAIASLDQQDAWGDAWSEDEDEAAKVNKEDDSIFKSAVATFLQQFWISTIDEASVEEDDTVTVERQQDNQDGIPDSWESLADDFDAEQKWAAIAQSAARVANVKNAKKNEQRWKTLAQNLRRAEMKRAVFAEAEAQAALEDGEEIMDVNLLSSAEAEELKMLAYEPTLLFNAFQDDSELELQRAVMKTELLKAELQLERQRQKMRDLFHLMHNYDNLTMYQKFDSTNPEKLRFRTVEEIIHMLKYEMVMAGIPRAVRKLKYPSANLQALLDKDHATEEDVQKLLDGYGTYFGEDDVPEIKKEEDEEKQALLARKKLMNELEGYGVQFGEDEEEAVNTSLAAKARKELNNEGVVFSDDSYYVPGYGVSRLPKKQSTTDNAPGSMSAPAAVKYKQWLTNNGVEFSSEDETILPRKEFKPLLRNRDGVVFSSDDSATPLIRDLSSSSLLPRYKSEKYDKQALRDAGVVFSSDEDVVPTQQDDEEDAENNSKSTQYYSLPDYDDTVYRSPSTYTKSSSSNSYPYYGSTEQYYGPDASSNSMAYGPQASSNPMAFYPGTFNWDAYTDQSSSESEELKLNQLQEPLLNPGKNNYQAHDPLFDDEEDEDEDIMIKKYVRDMLKSEEFPDQPDEEDVPASDLWSYDGEENVPEEMIDEQPTAFSTTTDEDANTSAVSTKKQSVDQSKKKKRDQIKKKDKRRARKQSTAEGLNSADVSSDSDQVASSPKTKKWTSLLAAAKKQEAKQRVAKEKRKEQKAKMMERTGGLSDLD